MMDWAMIRKSMDDAMQACIENDGVMDEAAKQLVAFVPADPNKEADAEWLEKERGWVKDQQFIHRLRHPLLRLQFSNFEGGTLYVFDDFQNVEFPNPTRMTVALFEAAAMEAMKHGE